MEGYVYVLVNSSMPNLVKIGYTTKSPKERASELSGTGVPNKFIVAYSVFVTDCVEVEKQIHNLLSDYRHNSDREFLEIDATQTIDYLQEVSETFRKTPSSTNNSKEEPSATLYLAKISYFSNIFRIGLIRESRSYLNSNNFREDIKELYQTYGVDILPGDIQVVYSEEIEVFNEILFKQMNSRINNVLFREKAEKINIYSDSNRYDERTLNFKSFASGDHIKIFDKVLNSIKSLEISHSNNLAKSQEKEKINQQAKKLKNLKDKGL
jgi:hypothetical protein